jgi:pyridoxal 5'-phosphate synthase pdxS subunit
METATIKVKRGLAEMLKGGVIMDVTTAEQAKIAEEAGAVAVMALERVPADIRAEGGVARMSDPEIITNIMAAVTIPVMAKARMIRTKGEAGTGDVVEAVRHIRTVNDDLRRVVNASREELMTIAKELGAPFELVLEVKELGRLPVVNFAAGGIATPADAALMMQLGCDGIFVGSGIFKSDNPAKRAKAIVEATAHYQDGKLLAEVSKGIGIAMRGIQVGTMKDTDRIAGRGW